jgi:hypothetical protein
MEVIYFIAGGTRRYIRYKPFEGGQALVLPPGLPGRIKFDDYLA